MKKIKLSIGLLALVLGFSACQKDGINSDTSFLNSAATTNANGIFDITNDNSGKVTVTPTADGGSSFVIDFGHGGATADVKPGYSASHIYPEGSYTVKITTRDLAGKETEASYPLQLTYRAPENLEVTTNADLHHLKVSADALYAASYIVYFGDVPNETGTPLAAGGEVSHDYADAGMYDVKVVALSGGAAQTEKVTPVHIYDPLGLPISYELPNINYFFGTFGGGQQFATVDNPDASGLNTSAKVGKFTRGYEAWSGTYTPLNIPIDMANGKKIKVLAYNPDPAMIGKKLNVELENGSTLDNGVAVLKTAFTTSGAWEELVFDFGTIAAIPDNETFGQLVLRFNDTSDGAGAVIYVDDFVQTN